MIEVHRQLESYVKSRNNEYSISFTLKEAEELLKYIHRLEVRNYKLEKALDKACNTLEDLEYHYCMFDLDYAESNLYHRGKMSRDKDEWKEWCLNEIY